jgi:hypothetical protein
VYVHPFAMASCGHRGHDGSHESEPLVRLNAQKELGNRRTVERSPVFCLCRSIAMPRTGWSPNTVPYGADQTDRHQINVPEPANQRGPIM